MTNADRLRYRRYGITPTEYSEMLIEQKGYCALCRTATYSYSSEGTTFSLSVDHDHVSGKIRGLLCAKCNRGLGLFNDDPELLRAAVEYLVNHGK